MGDVAPPARVPDVAPPAPPARAHEIAPLGRLLVEETVRAALLEDLGRGGDLTGDAVIDADVRARLHLVAREPGVLAGLEAARAAFALVDPAIGFSVHRPDGARLEPGTRIATVEGPARGLLAAERVALNFLGQLSGVASATASLVDRVSHTRARITDTRKTVPGLRAMQKHAVRLGGGRNHRFGLDDAILIKDNHVAIAGGVRSAVERARARAGHMVRIELEVDDLDQLAEAVALDVGIVLLDNMDLPTLARAVAMCRPAGIVTEASGRVNADTVRGIAETGVDLIAVGWITHSAPVLDIGFDA